MTKLSVAVWSLLLGAICAYLGQIWQPIALTNQRIYANCQYILFAGPDPGSNLGQAASGENLKLVGKARHLWRPGGRLCQRYVIFYPVRYKQQNLWICPAFQCDNSGKAQVYWNQPSAFGGYMVIVCLAGAVYFMLAPLVGAGCHGQRRLVWSHISGLLCLRLALLFWRIESYGTYINISGDENGYFAIAHALLSGKLPETMHFTIGLPLIYMPLILLGDAASFLEIGWQFQLANAVIGASVVLALVYLCVYLLTRSPIAAMVAGLFWFCCCCLAFPVPIGGNEVQGIQAFVLPWAPLKQYLPPDSPGVYFSNHFWAFNALSDHLVLLPLLLSLALLLVPARPLATLISGACFGLALLMRISNAIFFPLFLWLFAIRQHELPVATRLRHMLVFAALATLSYLPQAMLNWWVLGAPWKTPYYDQTSLYFSWRFLPLGSHFFLQTFFQIYLVVLSLTPLLIGNRYRLPLWGLVFLPLGFYCCYSCYGNIRFALPSLVFTTLLIGVAADKILQKWGLRMLLAAAIFGFLCLFDLLPRHFPVKENSGLFYFLAPELRAVILALAATSYCFWQRQPLLALACTIMIAIWLLATWHLLALLTVVSSIALGAGEEITSPFGSWRGQGAKGKPNG